MTAYDEMGRTAYTMRNIFVPVNPDGTDGTSDYSNRQVQLYQYDGEGRTIKTTQEGYAGGSLDTSISVDKVYDIHGRVVAESDPYDEEVLNVAWDANTQTFKDGTMIVPTKLSEYDDFGRLAAVVLSEVEHPDLAAGTMVRPRYEYGYDERGNLLTIRDNVYQVTSGGVTQVYYDHGGAADTFDQDYDTRVTQFTYDDQGRQTSRTLPLGVATPGNSTDFVESKHYDQLGRMTYEVSFEGVVTAYVYDAADGLDPGDAGRVVAKHYYNAESNYQTDALNGSLDASDETVAYEYDAWGRQISVTQTLTAHTRVTENVYDDTYGRLIAVNAEFDGNPI